jgi:hypothetical protein
MGSYVATFTVFAPQTRTNPRPGKKTLIAALFKSNVVVFNGTDGSVVAGGFNK